MPGPVSNFSPEILAAIQEALQRQNDGNVQEAAFHPGTPMPQPVPMPPPQPTDVPAQKLRDAVGGLFFQKPQQQQEQKK